MKKRVLPLVLVLALMLSVCAGAATARYAIVDYCAPSLTFSGKQATCKAIVDSSDRAADVDLTMTLYHSSGRYLASWPVTRTGTTTQYHPITIGETYILTLTGTVSGSNGTDQIDLSVSAECS